LRKKSVQLFYQLGIISGFSSDFFENLTKNRKTYQLVHEISKILEKTSYYILYKLDNYKFQSYFQNRKLNRATKWHTLVIIKNSVETLLKIKFQILGIIDNQNYLKKRKSFFAKIIFSRKLTKTFLLPVSNFFYL